MTPAGATAFGHRKDHNSRIYAYEQDATASLSPSEELEFKPSRS